MTTLKLLFATGGSGGHIYPALAVAQAAAKRGADPYFLGARSGMEARIIPQEGFPFHGVAAGKWDRQRPDPRQALAALRGLFQALSFTRKILPGAVIGFGGFASFPGCVAASLLRIPLVLHEGNALPGRVTRWFARRARLVIVAHPEAQEHLPRKTTTTYLPMPIREKRVPRDEARRALGLEPDALVTLVMGGSQGSVALNNAVPSAYRQLAKPGVTVLHSSGPRWHEDLEKAVRDLPNYLVEPYLDATTAWSAADLAITRAGSSTLAEAAFHSVPLITIPLPTAADDHQLHNAQAFQTAGGGRLIEERHLQQLPQVWRELLREKPRRQAAQAAKSLSPEGAAESIVNLIGNLLQGEKRPTSRRAA